MNLTGRHVVVVGAGTRPTDDPDHPVGNGRAIAIRAAREGATVTAVDRDEAALAETLRLIEAEHPPARPTAGVVADVSTDHGCAAALGPADPGSIDGLVINVGTGMGAGIVATTADQWDATFAVNLRAHFLLVRYALDAFADHASIVLIGSVAGLRPGSTIPAYDASKAGLIGFCRHLALEVAPRGIRANVVAPGLIDTPLGRAATSGRPGRARTPVPLGRQGTAWEVAAAVSFLLSDDASYITGQTLAVDGGLTLI